MDIAPIIIALIAAIPGSYAFIAGLKKDRVDAARLALEITDRLDKKVQSLEAKVTELQELIKTKDARIEEQDHCIVKLEARVDELETENEVLRLRLDVVEGSRRPKPKTGG